MGLERVKRGREGSIAGGQWRIEKRIARGGMASVYSAVHVQTDAPVALKILSREAMADAEAKERFLKEGYFANQVDHEGVVRIIDNGVTDDDRPFLVMELLEGENLEQRRLRNKGKLSIDDAVSIALSIADILSAAHDAGLVHRDVKPANVFLTKSGAVKLLDFGVAGRQEQSSEHTRTGIGCGTPMFMAPEHMTGSKAIDARADVFALGTTLYRILSGAFPFPSNSIPEYLLALQKRPPSLHEVDPEIPSELSDVVARALEKDPAKRWPDARAVAIAITKAMRPEAPPEIEQATVALRTIPRAFLSPKGTPIYDKTAVLPGSGKLSHDSTPGARRSAASISGAGSGVASGDRTPLPMRGGPPSPPSNPREALASLIDSSPGAPANAREGAPIPRSSVSTVPTRPRRRTVAPLLVVALALLSILTIVGAIAATPAVQGAAPSPSAHPR